jgi:hypothetical protein
MLEYKNTDKDVISLLEEFLIRLYEKSVGYSPARWLTKALNDLANHPHVPEMALSISFKYQDTHFFVIYSDHKIELSDSFVDGSESYTRFNFKYEIEGYSEHEGNLAEFRVLLLDSLDKIPITEISISNEEE